MAALLSVKITKILPLKQHATLSQADVSIGPLSWGYHCNSVTWLPNTGHSIPRLVILTFIHIMFSESVLAFCPRCSYLLLALDIYWRCESYTRGRFCKTPGPDFKTLLTKNKVAKTGENLNSLSPGHTPVRTSLWGLVTGIFRESQVIR